MESNQDTSQVADSERGELIEHMVVDTIHRQGFTKIRDVVATIQRHDKFVTTREIHDAVRRLEGRGEVLLSEQRTGISFVRDLRDIESNAPFWTTVLTSIAVMVMTLAVTLPEGWFWIKQAVSAAFLFIIPGYAMTNALIARNRVGFVERIGISIGLSLGILSLAGIVLAYGIAGIRLAPIVLSVAGIVILLSFIGAHRDYARRREARRSHGTGTRPAQVMPEAESRSARTVHWNADPVPAPVEPAHPLQAGDGMKSFEKLAKGSYYLILDNIVNMALGALFWIVLAKLIGAAPLGQSMVTVAFATSVIGFAGYGVQVTISKYMSEYNALGMPRVSKRILSLGLRLALIVSGSVAVAIALLSGYISTEAYNDPSMAVLLMITVLTFLPSQTVVSALMGAYQGAHKTKFALVTDTLYQLLRIGTAVFLVLESFGSYGIIVSFALASVAASVMGYVFFVPRLFPKGALQDAPAAATGRYGISGLRQIIKFSGHNYAAVGMKTLTAQIGVLIVGTQNFELAAFYGLSVLISNLVGGVMNAVSRALLPTATEEWTRGNKQAIRNILETGIRLSMLISGIGFLVLVIQPSQVLGLISEQYVEASNALRILVVASMMYSLGAIVTSMLNAANRASDVALIGIVSSSITIALTFALTPVMDIEGAAYALLAGSGAGMVMSFVTLKKKEGITISARSTVKPALAMAAGVAAGFGTMMFIHSTGADLAAAIAVYLGASAGLRVTSRKEMRMLAGIMRKKRSSN